MTKPLTTQNAQITTATVEVKTLTISGKQVTLSVFRQLREEPLIQDDDATLNGVPWGVVNYHPDKCGDTEQHIHVVWQRSTDLLRSAVFAPETATARSRKLAPGLLVEACIAEGLDMKAIGITGLYIDPGCALGDNSHRVAFVFDGMTLHGRVRHPFYLAKQGSFPREVRSLGELLVTEESASQLAEKHRPTASYRKTWQALGELPQLFIAV